MEIKSNEIKDEGKVEACGLVTINLTVINTSTYACYVLWPNITHPIVTSNVHLPPIDLIVSH